VQKIGDHAMKSLSIILICSAAVACSTVQPQVPQLEAPMPATPAQEQKQQDEEKRAPKKPIVPSNHQDIQIPSRVWEALDYFVQVWWKQ
jgi:hypothetical protein